MGMTWGACCPEGFFLFLDGQGGTLRSSPFLFDLTDVAESNSGRLSVRLFSELFELPSLACLIGTLGRPPISRKLLSMTQFALDDRTWGFQ